MPLTEGSRLGPYEILAQIGEGGMGQVYRAIDLNLKRTVALKVLPDVVAGDPDRLARFQREAEVLAALNHPNIAAIYGLEKSSGTTALVMELVEGPTLADLIAQRRDRGLPLPEVLLIARQIAEALEAAHDAGIVHRDLKPANIKVRADDAVKVLDFGLAKAGGQNLQSNSGANPTMTSPAMTQMGMILGTAAYMAPEQAKGRPVDRRADVWAFGAVLYEMVTGTRAFAGDDVSEVLASVLAREPDWSKLPADAPAINGVIRRCLERDPRQRFGDTQSVRLALTGALSVSSSTPVVPVVPAVPVVPVVPVVPGITLPWILAAAATIAAAALGVTLLNRPAPEPSAVVKSSILPPPNVAFDFDVTVGPAVISPNGKLIAFSGREQSGHIQLWVRPVDATDARPLAGTDGASFPFWAPDSKQIGFYSAARGRLERVDLAGGAPIVIASASYVRGACWGADGTVLYDTSDLGGTIMEVQIASDSTPKPLSPEQVDSHRSPWLLPDGKHFLYTDRSKGQIHVVSRDGKTDKLLADGTSHAAYAAGHLIFVRESTLLAQPFDPVTLELSGSAHAVAGDVQMLLGDNRGVFSVSDTGMLLYLDGAATSSMTLAWFDNKGTRTGAVGEVGSARGIRLSPDGQKTAIGLIDSEGRTNVWTVDLTTKARTQVTFAQDKTSLVSSFVAWSPDGRTVVYPVKRDDGFGIARRPAAGGTEEVLYSLPAEQRAIQYPRTTEWTRDGAILYSGSAAGGFYRLPLAQDSSGTRTAHELIKSPLTGQNIRLKPGEHWFSYQGGNTAVSGVFVEAYPDAGKRQPVAARGTLPIWAPDGKSLYYADDNMLTVVSVSESEGALQFGPPRAIMPIIVGRGFSYDVAKDGRILALVSSDARATRPLTLVQNWVGSLR